MSYWCRTGPKVNVFSAEKHKEGKDAGIKASQSDPAAGLASE